MRYFLFVGSGRTHIHICFGARPTLREWAELKTNKNPPEIILGGFLFAKIFLSNYFLKYFFI